MGHRQTVQNQDAASDQVIYCLLTKCSIKFWENKKSNAPKIGNELVLLKRVGDYIQLKHGFRSNISKESDYF